MSDKSVRARAVAAAAGIAAGFIAIPGAHAATVSVWGGGTGNWSNAANWASDAEPYGGTTGASNTAGDLIYITNSTTAVVNYDLTTAFTDNGVHGGTTATPATGGALLISAGNTLQASAATGSLGTLSLDGGQIDNGEVTGVAGAEFGLNNAGTIQLNRGSWTIVLGGNGGNNTQATYYGTNSGTIANTGTGTLQLQQNNNLFSSSGALNASPVLLNTGGVINNSGGGTLDLYAMRISNGTLNNTNGTLYVGAVSALSGVDLENGSTVSVDALPGGSAGGYLQLVVANGSILHNTGNVSIKFGGTGTANAAGEGAGMSLGDTATDTTSMENTGTITIENASTLASSSTIAQWQIDTSGSILNDGTINVKTDSTGGETTSINLGQSAAFGNSTGKTGSIIFNDNAANYVGAISSTLGTGSTLTLGSGQTLSGAVKLGAGQINLVNNGAIYANGVNPIVINTKSNTFTNNGALQVANGSVMQDANTDSINALAFGTGGNVLIYIDSDKLSSGQITISGGLDLGTNLASLAIDDIGSTTLSPGTTLTIMESSGITGAFQQSSVSAGNNDFDINYSGGDVMLTVVPEPASVSLLTLGALGALRRRRRR